MPSNLPGPVKAPQKPIVTKPSKGVTHYEFHFEEKLSGLSGAIVGILLLLALGAMFLLGLATLTVLLWIACGAIVFAAVGAGIRALFGGAKHS